MRLVTMIVGDGQRLGVVRGDQVVEVPDSAGWPRTMRALAGAPLSVLESIAAWSAGSLAGQPQHPLASVRLVSPIPDPGKIVAIGLNYADHAAEGGLNVPKAPLVFAKFPSTVVGPGDDVTWDRGLTDQVDYEAELGVVIGRRARNVAEADAIDHVFGYTCLNDVSARDLQFGDGQWVRGKSLDTFCPIGPWIVTTDEIPDPQALRIECLVNGEALQSSTTANMFFGVRQIIAHCSRAFRLEPGDVIATGTPSGVGVYKNPKRFLRDGDEMTIRIERIGDLTNRCRTTGEPAPG
jgi:2-keto-4-pentenoate hydratase/2-oxohepta-3-ene-1,7-dioic acid hydratase in catechol pathway